MNSEHLSDLEKIRDLKMAYSHFLDICEIDRLADLFTEDATCDYGQDLGKWVGRQSIYERFTELFQDRRPLEMMHVITNPRVKLDGSDRATGQWFLTLFNTMDPDKNPVMICGLYDDTYVKKDGRWLIDQSRVHFAWPKREYEDITLHDYV